MCVCVRVCLSVFALAQAHARAHTDTHADKHRPKNAHAQTHAQTRTHTHTHTHRHRHTQSHTHTHTHTVTHTHTHTVTSAHTHSVHVSACGPHARTGPVGLRRALYENAISGTLPASLSALTALIYLCARCTRDADAAHPSICCTCATYLLRMRPCVFMCVGVDARCAHPYTHPHIQTVT